jgi:hypothetical protein
MPSSLDCERIRNDGNGLWRSDNTMKSPFQRCRRSGDRCAAVSVYEAALSE